MRVTTYCWYALSPVQGGGHAWLLFVTLESADALLETIFFNIVSPFMGRF